MKESTGNRLNDSPLFVAKLCVIFQLNMLGLHFVSSHYTLVQIIKYDSYYKEEVKVHTPE